MTPARKIKFGLLFVILLMTGGYGQKYGMCGAEDTPKESAETVEITPVGVTFIQEEDSIKFRKAAELEKAGKKELAFTLYQELMDKSPDFIIHHEGIIYTGIQSFFNNKLKSMPAEDIKLYRKINDPVALGLFRRAKTEHDLKLLEKISVNYFNTSYGSDITEFLADYYMNAGNIGRAVYHYKRARDYYLWQSNIPAAVEVLLKTAACSKLLGMPAAYESARRELEPFYTEKTYIAGEQMTVENAVKLIDASFAHDAPPGNTQDDETWHYSGGGELNGLKNISTSARTAVRIWTFPPLTDEPENEDFENRTQVPPPSSADNICILPVYSGNTLYFHDGCTVYALDMENGKLFWAEPEEKADKFMAVEAYAQYKNDFKKTHAIFGMCIDNNRIFANIWCRKQPQSPVPIRQGMIAAFDIQISSDNRYAWDSVNANPSETDLKTTLFPAPPLAANGFVYAIGLILKPDPVYHLYCFNEADGTIAWKKYLPEPDQPSTGGTMTERDFYPVPLIVEKDSVLYILSNYGMLIAVDGYTGSYLWMTNYLAMEKPPAQIQPVPWRPFQASPQYRREANIANYPVATDDTVYFLPIDSASFFAVDNATGQISASINFMQQGRPPSKLEFLSVIDAVRNNQTEKIAVFIGDKITGYNLATGKEERASATLGYKPEGKALITNNCIFMPCMISDKSISDKRFFSVIGFKMNAAIRDPSTIPLRDNSNPGSLIATGDKLITVSAQRISAFQDSESFKHAYAERNEIASMTPETYGRFLAVKEKFLSCLIGLPSYLRLPSLDPFSLHYNVSTGLILDRITNVKLRSRKLSGGLFFADPAHHVKMAKMFFANNNFQDAMTELKYAEKNMEIADGPAARELAAEISKGFFQLHFINAKGNLNGNFFDSAAHSFSNALKYASTDEQKATAILGIALSSQKNDNLQAALINYHAVIKDPKLSKTIVNDITNESSSDETILEVKTRTKAVNVAVFQITRIMRNCIENGKPLPEYISTANKELESVSRGLTPEKDGDKILSLALDYPFTEKAEQLMRELVLYELGTGGRTSTEYASLYKQYFSYSTHYAELLMELERHCEEIGRFDLAKETLDEITARFRGREIATGNFTTIIDSYAAAKREKLFRLTDTWRESENNAAAAAVNFDTAPAEIPKTDGKWSILYLIKPEGYPHAAGRNTLLLAAIDNPQDKPGIECWDISDSSRKWKHRDTSGILGISGVTPFTTLSGIKGLLIKETLPELAQEQLPFLAGDVLLTVDDQPVTSVDELKYSLRGKAIGDQVKLSVLRKNTALVLSSKILPKPRTASQEETQYTIQAGISSSGNIIANYGTALYCLDRDSGNIMWKFIPPEINYRISKMCFVNTKIVLQIQKNPASSFSIVCLDETGGTVMWQRTMTDISSPPRTDIAISLVYPHLNTIIIRQSVKPTYSIIDCASGIEKYAVNDGSKETPFGTADLLVFPDNNTNNNIVKSYDLAMPVPDMFSSLRIGQIPGFVETGDSLVFTKPPLPANTLSILGYKGEILKVLASAELQANSIIDAYRDEFYTFNSQKPYPSSNQLQYCINIYENITARRIDSESGQFKLPDPYTIFLPLEAGNTHTREFLDDAILLVDTKTILGIDRKTRKISAVLDYAEKDLSFSDLDARFRRFILADDKKFYVYKF